MCELQDLYTPFRTRLLQAFCFLLGSQVTNQEQCNYLRHFFENSDPLHVPGPSVQLDKLITLTHFTFHCTAHFHTGMPLTSARALLVYCFTAATPVAGGDLLPGGQRSRGGASFHQSVGARPFVGHRDAEPRLGVGHLPPGLPAAAAHPAARRPPRTTMSCRRRPAPAW
jgi:hypothetical protein